MLFRLIVVLLALLTSACASNSALRITYESHPQAADVFEGATYFGKTPVVVNYVATPEFKAGGCMALLAVTLRWNSGASSPATPHSVCMGQSFSQGIRIPRPDVPGLERDIAYANYVSASNDLAAAQQASAAAQSAQAIGAALGQAIGCELAGGCANNQVAATPAPYVAPAPVPRVQTNACSDNLQCGIGMACVKQQGQLSGFCAKPVNQYGTPTLQSNPQFIRCSYDSDCAIGFRCGKQLGQIYGVCVK